MFFAGIWKGWRNLIVLLVTLYFPFQFPLQAAFFLGQGTGPNPILLGAWGLFWGLLGFTIWLSADDLYLVKPDNKRFNPILY